MRVLGGGGGGVQASALGLLLTFYTMMYTSLSHTRSVCKWPFIYFGLISQEVIRSVIMGKHVLTIRGHLDLERGLLKKSLFHGIYCHFRQIWNGRKGPPRPVWLTCWLSSEQCTSQHTHMTIVELVQRRPFAG